jgi:starch synthase
VPAGKAISLPRAGRFPAARLIEARHPNRVPLLILDCPEYFQRDGGPYLTAQGLDWPDNAQRFGLLSWVAALLASPRSPCDWRCELVHCNDWQTALAPAYLHWWGNTDVPSLVTIHNLAYQGIFPADVLPSLALPPESLDVNGIEYYGKVSFLKAGLFYAHRVSTVSPTYAREIQSEPLGFGLHGLLSARRNALEGILNGVDVDTWDPASDRYLSATYDADTLALKRRNTAALRERFGLNRRPEQPLLGVVSRLIEQKGIDLVVQAAEDLLALPAQLIVLGTGDAPIVKALAALAARKPGKVAFVEGFDESLSHCIEAGADIFLMPSRFEPCGLNQMYSQRYGTLPVVRRTGGLADSVVDCTPASLQSGTATGFVFEAATARALTEAVRRAVEAWRQPDLWQRLQRNAMSRDFGWDSSARRYVALYREMVGRKARA